MLLHARHLLVLRLHRQGFVLQVLHFLERALLGSALLKALRDQRTVEGADSGVPLSIKTGEKA